MTTSNTDKPEEGILELARKAINRVMKLRKYKVGSLYHWGSPSGGGQMYYIVGKNRHYIFLSITEYINQPNKIYVLSKKEADKQEFHTLLSKRLADRIKHKI